MVRRELEPEGFEPRLVRSFSRGNLKRLASRLQQAVRKPSGKNVGEIIDNIAKTPQEHETLSQAALTIRHLASVGLSINDITGVHVWSTAEPGTFRVDPLLKPRKQANEPVVSGRSRVDKAMPESQERALLDFFRANVRDLPQVTERWFTLPNPVEHIVETEEREGLIARITSGQAIDVNSSVNLSNITSEARQFAQDLMNATNAMAEKGDFSEAIDYIGEQMKAAQRRFSDNDLEAILIRAFYARGFTQDTLVQRGRLNRLPVGNKLRSLASLSSAADNMRGDIMYGYFTDHGKAIAECFGDAEMETLQRKVFEKIVGGQVEVIYHDTLRPTRRYSVPRDSEIGDLQRRITAKVQKFL